MLRRLADCASVCPMLRRQPRPLYLHQTSARGQCTKPASIPDRLHSADGGAVYSVSAAE
jgi:hypothetical protein